jgi:hypothetical protein
LWWLFHCCVGTWERRSESGRTHGRGERPTVI